MIKPTMFKALALVAVFALAFSVLAMPQSEATGSDNDLGTIIQNNNDGVIQLGEGEYTLSGTVTLSKDLKITSATGAESVTITVSGSPRIDGVKNHDLDISNVTFKSNSACVRIDFVGDSVSIDNCIFKETHIFANGNELKITNCQMEKTLGDVTGLYSAMQTYGRTVIIDNNVIEKYRFGIAVNQDVQSAHSDFTVSNNVIRDLTDSKNNAIQFGEKITDADLNVLNNEVSGCYDAVVVHKDSSTTSNTSIASGDNIFAVTNAHFLLEVADGSTSGDSRKDVRIVSTGDRFYDDRGDEVDPVMKVATRSGSYTGDVPEDSITVVEPEPEEPTTPPTDDDDFVPPFVPSGDGGNDTTMIIAACAAAAVVALLAVLLVMTDRKK